MVSALAKQVLSGLDSVTVQSGGGDRVQAEGRGPRVLVEDGQERRRVVAEGRTAAD